MEGLTGNEKPDRSGFKESVGREAHLISNGVVAVGTVTLQVGKSALVQFKNVLP